MATSAIAGLLDVWHDLAVAQLEDEDTLVHYGPGLTDDSPDTEVFIGVDNLDTEGFPKMVEEGQQELRVAGQTKDELFIVKNVIVVRNGDNNLRAAKTAAFTKIGLLETAARGDHTIAAAGVLWVNIAVTDVDSAFTEDAGAVIRVYFDLQCRARI
jgi:hypothetical protein